MTTAVRQKLAAHARSRRDAYVAHTLEMVADGALTRRDVEQMIDGFLALLTEALTTDSREIRTFFLETVIPGLVATGTPPSGVVGGVARFAVFVSIDAVGALPEAERDEASRWLATFFNDYITDMVRIATQEQSK